MLRLKPAVYILEEPYKLQIIFPSSIMTGLAISVVIDSGSLIRKDPPANKNAKQSRPRQPNRGGTVLRGRSRQQFVEVDPIDVDTRFFTKLLLCLVPK